MNDPIIRSEQQPSFEELRCEFREQNLKRVRQMLHKHLVILRDRHGVEVKRFSTGFSTTQPDEHRRVDEWLAGGNRVPDFTELAGVFDIPDSAGLDKELRDLSRDARLLHQGGDVERPHSSVERGTLQSPEDDTAVLQYLDEQHPPDSLHPQLQQPQQRKAGAP